MANCLHYSPVAELLKNPAGHAGYTGDASLTPGSGRPLEKEMATPPQYSMENSRDRGAWQATVHGDHRAGHN